MQTKNLLKIALSLGFISIGSAQAESSISGMEPEVTVDPANRGSINEPDSTNQSNSKLNATTNLNKTIPAEPILTTPEKQEQLKMSKEPVQQPDQSPHINPQTQTPTEPKINIDNKSEIEPISSNNPYENSMDQNRPSPDVDVSKSEDGDKPDIDVSKSEDGDKPDIDISKSEDGQKPDIDVSRSEDYKNQN